MPIDSEIYKRGIRGELSEREINSLPSNYRLYKQFFMHALEIRKQKDS